MQIDFNTLLAFLGTLVGTFGGIVASSKLTAYRIEQLEKKVDKHNNFAEQIPVLKSKIEDVEKDISDINNRIINLTRRQ